MYFYKQGGKQILDMRGDLVLSHNDQLVRGRVKSAAPAAVRNASYVVGIHAFKFRDKLRATRAALRFIWARNSQALTAQTIDSEGL